MWSFCWWVAHGAAPEFNGGGMFDNSEPIVATEISSDEDSWAWATISLPPMSAIWLRYQG